MKAYCVKCKESRELKDGKAKKTKNGRDMMQGPCPECGTTMSVFVKSTDVKKEKEEKK